MKNFNAVFFSGAAAGLIAGCLLGVWLAQPPSAQIEHQRLEKQKAALQMSIKALDTYYQMLTNNAANAKK